MKHQTNKEIFSGNHQLRKLRGKTTKYSTSSAGFFLFVGGYSSSSGERQSVMFSWLTNDGDYAISSIEPTRIRVKFNNSLKTPYITFNYDRPDRFSGSSLEMRMIYRVKYIVVHCKEEDFNVEIDLNSAFR